ncbi:MAG TPA: tetratricopeptide repeat protein [Rubricoccaceae bacterium]
MTRCPACGRRYGDDARFCALDGTALVPVGVSVSGDEGGSEPRVLPPPPASRALDDLLAQPGRPGPGSHGLPPVPGSAPGVDPEWEGDELEPDEPSRSRRAWRVGLAVAIALLLGGAVGAYLLMAPRSLEQEAYDAIERGDLVTPARVSAYDFAQRLAERYPKSGAAGRVGAAAFPRLIASMDAFYARFYTTSEASDADWSRTARLAEWATAIAPADAHVRARAEYAAARVAALDGDREGARAGYERAAAAWPEWALPPNSLGVLLAQQGDVEGAEARYREAAALDPAWAFPLANLGGLYLRHARYDDAEDALRRAVAADPERPYPHAMLARAYAGLDRLDEAVASASEALQLDPAGATGFDARRLRADVERWRARDAAADEPAFEGLILDELEEIEPADTTSDL